ncbi:THC0290_0291 family protein [Flavobacterium sp. N3904]|uniref:THC0290_0291 family protein n=1 Tax=Flavobacterium sp. N3904 TaxID=2986835 RepID=UPI002224B447|nr:glutamate dehydrogenase [Flavobacterium sp. N3904]
MIKLKIFILLILMCWSNRTLSQSGIVHEIGVIAGPVQFRSDYGQRDNVQTNMNNTGFGLGIIDYLNFSYNDNQNIYFKEHFKIRNELSYSKTDLQNYGQWVEKNTLPSQQLAAMRGSTQLINLGTQLEFYPLHIHDFENTMGSFAPYASLGIQISYYSATATSTMGELGNTATTHPKYLVPSDGHPHGYATESKAVISEVFDIGTRYKLNRMSDLIIDLRYQHFESDWVDGLNPNKDIYTENKSNDSLLWLTVGYIFYLEN